jgi:hypothetical protein
MRSQPIVQVAGPFRPQDKSPRAGPVCRRRGRPRGIEPGAVPALDIARRGATATGRRALPDELIPDTAGRSHERPLLCRPQLNDVGRRRLHD